MRRIKGNLTVADRSGALFLLAHNPTDAAWTIQGQSVGKIEPPVNRQPRVMDRDCGYALSAGMAGSAVASLRADADRFKLVLS